MAFFDTLQTAGVAPPGSAKHPAYPESGNSASGLINATRSIGSSNPVDNISQAISNAAGLSAANSALSNQYAREQRDWQAKQTKSVMDFNAAEAAKNRNWQELLSNTAHQREIKDLQAAGLNPVLSASGGNGAAVTSGASASASSGSGSKGDVDTSANSAIVSLLGSWIASTTALQNQQVSAQANLAVADKYNAMSELVAHITGEYGLENTRQAGRNAINTANVQAAAVSALSAQGHAQDMEYTKMYPANPYQLTSSLGQRAGELKDKILDRIDSVLHPPREHDNTRGGGGRKGH